MRLGVDLDNTLVCYDGVFLWGAHFLRLIPDDWTGNKQQLWRYLQKRPDGDVVWQRLQGQVYGKWAGRARLYPGVYRFLWRCKYRDVSVEILSHKTEYGHQDEEKISLRQEAKYFLEKVGIIGKGSSSLVDVLEFFTLREEKIERISERNFDWFIDDLPQIIDADRFPTTTNKIGFDPTGDVEFKTTERVASWTEIESRLLGQWTTKELLSLAGQAMDKQPIKAIWVGGKGNAGISRIQYSDMPDTALKIYPDDMGHNRLYSEYQGIYSLRKSGISCVPEQVGCSRPLNIGMYRWIDGAKVNDPTDDDVEQALKLIEQIHALRGSSEFRSFPNASAAVFSGHQLEMQYQNRFNILDKSGSESSDLKQFFDDDLKPASTEIIRWCRDQWPIKSYDKPIPIEHRTLSPSDFGFHNVLRASDNGLIFLDFEYFGWDDPAKLTGDFILHPGMQLSDRLKARWINGAKTLFGGATILRLRAMWPLLGLCWCLILLNEFRSDIWIRRIYASGNELDNHQPTLDRQLKLSKELLANIWRNYRDFPYE